MIPQIRTAYNQKFTNEAYLALQNWIGKISGEPCTFRLCETPVFVPNDLKEKLLRGCEEITSVLCQPDFKAKSEAAIPAHLRVPNETENSLFLQLDFGICQDENGELLPQLIEMQGFPSLYFFQYALSQGYEKHFDIPEGMSPLQSGLDKKSYLDVLNQAIVGDAKPEEVVLLEIEPHKQNTRIDFWLTAAYLGIKVLCLSKVIKEGQDLFYEDEKTGRKIQIRRIYNRIIFDELEKRNDLPRQWNLLEPVNAEWVGHPNWFFRISKHSLPFIKSQFVPDTYFLSDLKPVPTDLENWVLKPLFSFSGMGVNINVTPADIDAVKDPENWILQRKMPYVPVVDAPDEKVKCEIRMMFIWPEGWEKPLLVNNLVRMSKGEMVGVRYNKNKDWVGASVAFFSND